MNKNIKILLFAHPRSGSTALMQVLNLHPEINLMQEPFNEGREKWAKGNKNYKNETKTIENLNRVLAEIHEAHNGFKHLAYQLPEDLTKYLLTKEGYKVIFLCRKNLLKSIVSGSIAKQTNVWTPEEKEQKGKLKSLQPLNIEELRKEIAYAKDDLRGYRKIMQETKAPLLELTYEDLFDELENARLEKIKEIFRFLDLEFPNGETENIKKLLLPKRKITSNEMYELIPNIQEVEKELGSKENGFLFK